MTTAADDTAAEAAFEAFLAGRPVPEEAADLAAFAGAVRTTATLPGRPSAALAELLATGLLTDQPSPSARTASSAGSQPRRSRVRRRRLAMFFPALVAKFLSAGAVAQAASGAGIALVAFTGAGAVGVLPGPVQDTFSSIVGTDTASDETAVPEDTTGTETGDVTEVEDPASTTPEVVPATDLTIEDWEKGPTPDQSFGDWVSQGARHGYADGATISEWAHKRNDERRGGATESTAPSAETEAPEVEDDDATETEAPEVGSGSRGGSSHGGGNSGRGHN
jgi:hypothetical protein